MAWASGTVRRSGNGWGEGQVLAWTEHDGPGRPPSGGGRALRLALAGSLAVVFAGMLATDALCPEHRAWVQGLATVALAGTAVAGVGLARGWGSAPLLTVGVASVGVAIGALDAVHSATRGRLLIVAFAVVALGAATLAARQGSGARWGRRLARAASPVAPVAPVAAVAGPVAPEPAGEVPVTATPVPEGTSAAFAGRAEDR